MKDTVQFESCLGEKMDAYLALRESLGHRASKERHIFISLDRYLKNAGFHGQELSPYIIDSWLASLPKELNANTVNVYISHYAQFAGYLRSFGYTAFIPEKSIVDKSYVPYVFDKDEISALVKAADNLLASLPEKRRHNAACFTIMLRMLAGCGFRVNEVRLLETRDVDMDKGIIYVKNAKGNRDRIVPMHSSLTEILRVYAGSGIPLADGWFFPAANGRPVSYSWIRAAFRKCLGAVGIEMPALPKHSRGVCLHCLRHSYAVAALCKLDADGFDLYSEMPVLSTYMGHENLYGTEHYLHMTAENSHDIISKMEIFSKGLFPEVPE